MLIKGTDLRTVFLLGAGATRGAVEHVVVKRRRIKPPLNGDFFDVVKKFAEAQGSSSSAGERYSRLMRVFRTELRFHEPRGNNRGRPKLRMPTMEEAFSILYVAKDFPSIYRTGRGRKPAPGERREIEDFLRLAFGVFSVMDVSENKTGYDRLVEVLGPKDTVLTLNYDTLFDSALHRIGWDPHVGYCLTGGTQKYSWPPARVSIPAQAARVKLIKLHGSLNWFVRGTYKDLGGVFEKKPVLVTRPRRKEITGHIRQIVPPIFGKFFAHSHWRALWSTAYRELCQADCLVVVGSSLVESDFHLRALLNRVSRQRKAKGTRFERLVLVDYMAARRRWEDALQGTYAKKASYTRFEGFLESGAK